jgi:DNA-binding CsgD family transcriptional regulator
MANDKPLSLREQEVLVLLWKGFTSREISHTLHRSINTIAMHRKHILKKLGARTTVAALHIAAERRLVSLPPLIFQEEDPIARTVNDTIESCIHPSQHDHFT